jgi:TctA family transporter
MLIWFFKGFYPDKKLKTIILKVFAVIGLVILAYVILVLIAAIIAIVVGMILGPEVLKQFKPQ